MTIKNLYETIGALKKFQLRTIGFFAAAQITLFICALYFQLTGWELALAGTCLFAGACAAIWLQSPEALLGPMFEKFDHWRHSLAEIGEEVEHLDAQLGDVASFEKAVQTFTEQGELAQCKSLANSQLQHLRTVMQKASALADARSSLNKCASKSAKLSSLATRNQLLAYNGFLEAARATDHNEGFMAIAEEMGELSAQSKKACTDLSELSASADSMLRTGVSQTLTGVEQAARASHDLFISLEALDRSLRGNDMNTTFARLEDLEHKVSGLKSKTQALCQQLDAQHHTTNQQAKMTLPDHLEPIAP